MIVETTKGKYELLKNVKDAFVKSAFEERYIEECFDKYDYLVGDVSAGILRIKGFSSSDQSYKMIPDYLNESCAYNCAFYILHRIKEK